MPRLKLSFGLKDCLIGISIASACLATVVVYTRNDTRGKLRDAFGSVEAGELIRLSERIEIHDASWAFDEVKTGLPDRVPRSTCGNLLGTLRPEAADKVRKALLNLGQYPRDLAVDVLFEARTCMRFVSKKGHIDLYYTDKHDVGLVVLGDAPQALVFLNFFPQDPRHFIRKENLRAH